MFAPKHLKSAFTALLLVALSGCSTTAVLDSLKTEPKKPAIELSSLYVRGIFNWWEADTNYQLKPIGANRFGVEISLIADGQPYDFKLADDVWSNYTNCGAADFIQTIRPNNSYELYCGEDSQNLQFTPEETGDYWIVVYPTNRMLLLTVTQR